MYACFHMCNFVYRYCSETESGPLLSLKLLTYFCQPIYGFANGDPLRFKRAAGHKDLFYINDKEVEFKDVRPFFESILISLWSHIHILPDLCR